MKDQLIKEMKIIGRNKFGAPIVKCEYREDFPGGLKFYCSYCKKWHLHGRGLGHRAAHCVNQNSPFHKKGYSLFMEDYKENYYEA